jgi:uncharacterized membrane protein YoaK (UPF0700 family)
MTVLDSVHTTLFAVYVFVFTCINFISYLISHFYQKKFNQPSPRLGFLTAIFLALLSLVCILLRDRGPKTCSIILSILLTGSAIAATWSSVYLYTLMSKVRK